MSKKEEEKKTGWSSLDEGWQVLIVMLSIVVAGIFLVNMVGTDDSGGRACGNYDVVNCQ